MKKNEEHTIIFIIGIIIAAGIAAYRGAEFDLFTIIGVFIGGLMIFGGIVTILQRW
tara:strand:+ start:341 stop:508 length:168 start_codon:yes stop_codon:yes gene_type:complete